MSLALVQTNQVYVHQGIVLMYGLSPGKLYQDQYVNLADTSGVESTFDALAAQFTDAQVVTNIATNLGLASDTAITTWLTSLVATFGKGGAVKQLLDALPSVPTTSSYYSNVTDLTAKVAASITHSEVAGSAVSAAVISTVDSSSGTTFVLTASTAGDDFTGTASADTFSAASTSRLQDADVLDGGLGTDTLTAKLNSSSAHDATINDIEILNFEVLGTSTVTGANIVGATNVNLTGGAVLTYTGHKTEVFNISEDGTGLTATKTADTSGGNTITITVADELGTLTLGDAGDSSGDGYEYKTINLVVAGDGFATLSEADAGTDQTDDGWFASGESIVVTGEGDFALEIAGALLGANTASGTAVAATINGAGHTGTLTVDIGQLAANEFFEASKLTGVDVLRLSTGSGDDDTILNLLTGASVYVDGIENAVNELTVDPNGSGTSDVLNITLGHATAGSSIDLNAFIADGFETVNITSTGTDSSSATVTNVLDDIAGLSTDTTLTIAGDKAFTATGVESTWTTITSTNTAGVNLTVDSGGALTFTGGSGNDRLELDTVADLTTADTLEGGVGTDTLAFSAIPSAVTSAQLGRISGFEILEFEETNTLTAAAAVDISGEAGLNEVKFNGALTVDDGATNTYTMTVTGVDGLTVDLGAVVNTATGNSATTGLIFVVDGAANAGTNDTVTIKAQDAGAGDLANAAFSIDNVENLNIQLTGDGDADGADKYTMTLIDGAQLTNVVVTSTNTGTDSAGDLDASDDLVITAMETTLLTLFDASASTGKITMQDVSAFISTGATISGGSAVDALTGGVGADVINGNGAGDTLNGDQGNDTINGGAGNDNINGDVGTDTLTGGAGSDTFVFDDGESTEAATDSVTDFQANPSDSDTDTLDFAETVSVSANIAVGSAHDVKDHTTETDTAVSAYVTNGIIKLTGADAANVDTLAEWVDIAEDVAVNGWVDTGNTVEVAVIGFQFGGDTYVVHVDDGDSDGTVATEAVVKLVGISADAISATPAANTIHVA